ncbi:MAG: hypothetical protein AAF138_02460 [Planctomycetota bacterium]
MQVSREQSRTLLTVAVAAVAVISAFVSAAWFLRGSGSEVLTDGGALVTPAEAAAPRSVLWNDPTRLPASINTPAPETSAAFSSPAASDADFMIFSRGAPGSGADLYIARRQGRTWAPAQPFEPANSNADEIDPAIAPDGSAVYFASDRAGGLGGYDLYRVLRSGDGWSSPEPLGADINSPLHDTAPALTPDGATIYFASNRAAQGEPDGLVGAERFRRPFNLFSVRLAGDANAERVALSASETDTEAHHTDPAISPAGDFLYFASNRAHIDRDPSRTDLDLYRVRLADGAPSEVVERLTGEVNTLGAERGPTIGMEGFELRFSSDRSGQSDLYRAVSREVYRDLIVERAAMDWAALWNAAWPWLLTLLIAMLLLWFLSRLMREVQWIGAKRAIGLMTWCALLSVVVHAALALLFAVIQVTASTGAQDRGAGPTRVIMSRSAGGGGVAAQVRAALTDASLAAAAAEQARAELSRTSEASQSPVSPAPSATPAPALTSELASASPNSAARPMQSAAPAPVAVEMPASSTRAAASVRAPDAAQPARSDEAPRSAPVASAAGAPAATLTEAAGATSETAASPLAPADAAGVSRPIAFDGPVVAQASREGAAATPLEVAAATDGIASAPAASNDLRTPVPNAGDATGDAQLAEAVTDGPPSAEFALSQVAWTGPAAETGGAESREVPLAPNPSADTGSQSSRVAMDLGAAPPSAPSRRPATGLAVNAPAAATALTALALPGVADATDGSDETVQSEGQAEAPIARFEGAHLNASGDPARPEPNAGPLGVIAEAEPAPAERTLDVNELGSDFGADAGGAASAPMPAAMALPELSLAAPALSALATPSLSPPVLPEFEFSGLVLDAETREPLQGAVVRLDLDEDPIEVITDATGAFVLRPESVPDHAAITASLDGYATAAGDVPEEAFRARSSGVLLLERVDPDIIALEDEPEVHHLGDDRFSGRVNSQFQKQSSGLTYRAAFEVPAETLGEDAEGRPVIRAELRGLAKGAQLRNEIWLNGRRLRATLSDAPPDGSFGPFAVDLPVDELRPGGNTLRIVSVRQANTDHDDFEFVNLELVLVRPEADDRGARDRRPRSGSL